MELQELIQQIVYKNESEGIKVYPPATFTDIAIFENRIGCQLPSDFKDFYLICNGFECQEDIFNMIQLSDIPNHADYYGTNWFYFSEYMIYSDMWGVRVTAPNKYEIFAADVNATVLSSSLHEFLGRFLKGNVFEKDGLYDWLKEFGVK